ncbi:hypothetical protein [Spiroplasma culicicola]|uniref:Uncharacterized protein n=1 Tax=Spiroplasma culicicola AES-1 TaxID=1276246 RepID=W6A5P4_9MOLU|nr:hypothetical protein [Spiroplasma culicicola]AHI52453.1 hypothetical protein SCULI_v1c01120 [Spiroplasma culicicola AES-1]
MNDNKNIILNQKETLIHIIYHQSIPDQFVLNWQKENKFNLNCDYQIFLKFVKINFNVDFEFTNPKSISKGKWVSTRENDIMLMETQKDKLLGQYIKSYNDYVSIDKGELMPRFTLECRKLYIEQKNDMKKIELDLKMKDDKIDNQQIELNNTNWELNKLKLILEANGLNKNKTRTLNYILESNIFSPGEMKILKLETNSEIKFISSNENIIKVTKLKSDQDTNLLEFNIHALKIGAAKIIFIEKNYEPLEIELLVN